MTAAPFPWIEGDCDFFADEEIEAQILEEFEACAPLGEPFYEGVAAAVGSDAGLDRLTGVVRIARVVFLDGGGFEFSDDKPDAPSKGALIFLVRNRFGHAIDLAAWPGSGAPTLWHSRGCLLGEDGMFWRPRLNPSGALIVHPTAGRWLHAGGRGCVIIDPLKAAPLLRRAGLLEAASTEHALELRDMLELRRPSILVPEGAL